MPRKVEVEKSSVSKRKFRKEIVNKVFDSVNVYKYTVVT